MTPPVLLTPAEAAAIIRKTSKGLWQLVDAGKLRAVEFPGHRRGWRFMPADIAACIQKASSTRIAGPVVSSDGALIEIDTLLANSMSSKPISAVYFLIQDSTIVYVGQSTDLFGRISTHRSTGRPFERFTYIEVPIADLDRVEATYIHALRPAQNKAVPQSGFDVDAMRARLESL